MPAKTPLVPKPVKTAPVPRAPSVKQPVRLLRSLPCPPRRDDKKAPADPARANVCCGSWGAIYRSSPSTSAACSIRSRRGE